MRVRTLGQGGLLITYSNINILVDPYLSNSVEEKDSSDLKRLFEIPYNPRDLKNINWVLITHDHLDHCDPDTLPYIANASPSCRFMGPNPVRKLLKKWGICDSRILPANSEFKEIEKNFHIKSMPALHPKLIIGDDGEPNTIGWFIKYKNKNIYIAGDTCLSDSFIKKLKECEVIDLCFLPVNEDNYFRRKRGIIGNMSIREAFALANEIGVKELVPIHWDMFKANNTTPEEIFAVFNSYEWDFKLNLNKSFWYEL